MVFLHRIYFSTMQNLNKYLAAFLLVIIAPIAAHAQIPATSLLGGGAPDNNSLETCGASFVHENLLRTNENYRRQVAVNQTALLESVSGKTNARQAQVTGVLQIPVVVHIVHTGEAVGVGNNISDAQVQSAITALNDMYRRKPGTNGYGGGVDMEIEFQLATKDPNCNPTTGIVRVNGSTVPNYATSGVKANSVGADEVTVKNLSRWPTSDYYNIWVVTEIEGNDGGSGIQGYAYFPNAPAYLDGTIILNSAFGTTGTVKWYTNRGQTLAHELGHAFNLYHTFEGDDNGSTCPPEVDGCGTGQGDCIADTEPHKRSASNCPVGTVNSCTNTTIGSVYKNYMDYSSQNCSNEFTALQKAWVRSAIENLRPGLLNSNALNSATASLPASAQCSPSGTVASNNYGVGILKVALNERAVTSGGTVSDNALFVDRTCGQQFSVSNGTPLTVSVNTGTANNENLRVYLDYNNNGNYTDAGELVLTSNNARTHTATFSPPVRALKNTPLRMRVISDFVNHTITGPCYVPVLGQTEEYTLFLTTPLPVSLVSFQAKKAGPEVSLNWKTAQEINNAYFEIERSANAAEWEAVGRIAGKGTTSSAQNYSFTDKTPLAATNYYRLKQVDLDGTATYSAVEQVRFDQELSALTVFPNPGTGLFTLNFSEKPIEPVQLRIFNLNGSLVYQRKINTERQYQFSLTNLPAGLYLLEVSDGKIVTRIKLVKE